MSPMAWWSLFGTVHNADEKSKAVSIAQAVPKVVSVNDNLQLAAARQAELGFQLPNSLIILSREVSMCIAMA